MDYGADAVYIGGAKFGARYAAGNSAGEIARVVEYAHRYGVRVHATLNTLIYDDELEAAERQARELIAAGVMLRMRNIPSPPIGRSSKESVTSTSSTCVGSKEAPLSVNRKTSCFSL